MKLQVLVLMFTVNQIVSLQQPPSTSTAAQRQLNILYARACANRFNESLAYERQVVASTLAEGLGRAMFAPRPHLENLSVLVANCENMPLAVMQLVVEHVKRNNKGIALYGLGPDPLSLIAAAHLNLATDSKVNCVSCQALASFLSEQELRIKSGVKQPKTKQKRPIADPIAAQKFLDTLNRVQNINS